MNALPSGTVTFLFTDIEGSTSLLRTLGDRYAEVLRQQRQILRETLGGAEGREIDTQGDAFFFSFMRARDAVSGAVNAQRALAEHRWPDGIEVKVRMGLHTGEPAVGDEGYVGLDVVRAARICSAGHGRPDPHLRDDAPAPRRRAARRCHPSGSRTSDAQGR